jgi:hypothetical protein
VEVAYAAFSAKDASSDDKHNPNRAIILRMPSEEEDEQEYAVAVDKGKEGTIIPHARGADIDLLVLDPRRLRREHDSDDDHDNNNDDWEVDIGTEEHSCVPCLC